MNTFLPPRIHVEISHEPIDRTRVEEFIDDPDVGAHLWFEGVTRRMTAGQETVRLCYEAFEPMAKQTLGEIAVQTLDEFQLTALVVVHRLGWVPVGEASLLVGCSSTHRAAAIESLAKFINRLKTDVPIWKKEYFADGSSSWVHPT